MNLEMVRRWNHVVDIDDWVYYLGDFSLSEQAVIEYSHQLNGKKILIPGNHDQCFPDHMSHEKHCKKMAFYQINGWTVWPLDNYIVLQEQRLRLNHFPYVSKETFETYEVKYKKYRPVQQPGELLLHGHIHGHYQSKPGIVNVGVDVWDFYPVTLEQILATQKET